MADDPGDLDAKLNFLRSPAAFGAPGTPVVTIETHMSWLFLAGDQAFKLKKPVRHAFLDFSSLESRAFYCREEVRLNRRLAPGVYLGVVALQWHDGRFSLRRADEPPAPGRTVDWLVRMRRLPAAMMLDRRIATHDVREAEVDAVVDVLAAFYRGAAPVALGGPELRARFERERSLNRSVLLDPRIDAPGAAPALQRCDAASLRLADLLEARATGGHVVDGHGDLRAEHVCLLGRPVVIDCLEFNPGLRQLDPFDEIAYLGLECSIAGAPWIAPRLLVGVAAALPGRPPGPLLALYTAHRALLRARLALAHLLDAQPRDASRWPIVAEHYLEHARAALDEIDA